MERDASDFVSITVVAAAAAVLVVLSLAIIFAFFGKSEFERARECRKTGVTVMVGEAFKCEPISDAFPGK